jgi:replicative DNA helicase
VIILSPAYKLMRGDPKEDRDVQNLLDVIDRVRVQHKAAVIIETHAPHGQAHGRDMRPYGSSVWLRWPEIGIGLQRNSAIPDGEQERKPTQLETVDWRGAREERDWPTEIRYGSKHEPPWVNEQGIESYTPSEPLSYQIPTDEGRAA